MKNGIERNTSTSRGIYVASKNTPESCTDGRKHCEKRVLRSVIAARVPRQNEPDTTVAAAIYATAAVVESVRARRSYHRVRRPGACDDGYGGGWETNARKEKVRLPVCVYVCSCMCVNVLYMTCVSMYMLACVCMCGICEESTRRPSRTTVPRTTLNQTVIVDVAVEMRRDGFSLKLSVPFTK